MQNYYALLGLSGDFTSEELETAYSNAIAKHREGAEAGIAADCAKTIELKMAHDTLADFVQRGDYDKFYPSFRKEAGLKHAPAKPEGAPADDASAASGTPGEGEVATAASHSNARTISVENFLANLHQRQAGGEEATKAAEAAAADVAKQLDQTKAAEGNDGKGKPAVSETPHSVRIWHRIEVAMLAYTLFMMLVVGLMVLTGDAPTEAWEEWDGPDPSQGINLGYIEFIGLGLPLGNLAAFLGVRYSGKDKIWPVVLNAVSAFVTTVIVYGMAMAK